MEAVVAPIAVVAALSGNARNLPFSKVSDQLNYGEKF
jgi:hypothetical protein